MLPAQLASSLSFFVLQAMTPAFKFFLLFPSVFVILFVLQAVTPAFIPPPPPPPPRYYIFTPCNNMIFRAIGNHMSIFSTIITSNCLYGPIWRGLVFPWWLRNKTTICKGKTCNFLNFLLLGCLEIKSTLTVTIQVF